MNRDGMNNNPAQTGPGRKDLGTRWHLTANSPPGLMSWSGGHPGNLTEAQAVESWQKSGEEAEVSSYLPTDCPSPRRDFFTGTGQGNPDFTGCRITYRGCMTTTISIRTYRRNREENILYWRSANTSMYYLVGHSFDTAGEMCSSCSIDPWLSPISQASSRWVCDLALLQNEASGLSRDTFSR